MNLPRVIPCLLLKGQGLVKTRKFKNPQYVGDPINAVRIFNEKMVDELAFLDITATAEGRAPNLALLEQIANECFMPLLYGGAITTVEHARRILQLGVEKICLNTSAINRPEFISELASEFGSQSVVVSIDVRRSLWGKHKIIAPHGDSNVDRDPEAFARQMEDLGAGELLLNSVDRDGTMEGYDIDITARVSDAVSIPVIACGGAGSLQDLKDVINETSVSAVAAGSLFVFYGKHRAVLISYPTREQFSEALTPAA